MVQSIDDWSDHGEPNGEEQEKIVQLDRLWLAVEEGMQLAKSHLSWSADILSTGKGYIPGLKLIGKQEITDESWLTAGQCEAAIKSIIEMKSGVAADFKIPRISMENWDIGDGDTVIKQLPGYIQTNAAIMLRALYDRYIEEGDFYLQQRDEFAKTVAAKKERLAGLSIVGEEGEMRVDLLERRVSDVVSGVQSTQMGWDANIKSFLSEILSGGDSVDDRLESNMIWAPVVVQILRLPLSEIRDSADFTNRMQNALLLNHNIMGQQDIIEQTIDTASTNEERVVLAFAFNIYEDCKKIIGLYGELIKKDGSQGGYIAERTSKFEKDQWETKRQEIINSIKMYSFDAHCLAVEKLIKELEIYLSTWENVLGHEEKCEAVYSRDMLKCDQQDLEIRKKFFEGKVLTEDEAKILREQVGHIAIDRKLLEMEKRLILDGASIIDDERKELERNVELLRIHKEIRGEAASDGRKSLLEKDGEYLLISRQRDMIVRKLGADKTTLSDKERSEFEYTLESLNIDLKIVEIERELGDGHSGIEAAKKSALETNKRKLYNEKRILDLDKQLKVAEFAMISGDERSELEVERGLLIAENHLCDLDVMKVVNDERIHDILFFANSIADFCEKLRGKGEQYLKYVAIGKDLASRENDRELEYESKAAELVNLYDVSNEKIKDYHELAEMVQLGQKQLASMSASGGSSALKYDKLYRRVGLLQKQMEDKKIAIGFESERINDCKNELNDVHGSLDVVRGNLAHVYSEAITVMGGNSMDVQTYMWVLGTIKLILTKVAGLHNEAGQLARGVTEQLIKEITEVNQGRRLSDVGMSRQRIVAGTRTFKPTMMSARDATYYPVPDDDNRPRVQVIDAPKSYRHDIQNAIGDVMGYGKKDV